MNLEERKSLLYIYFHLQPKIIKMKTTNKRVRIRLKVRVRTRIRARVRVITRFAKTKMKMIEKTIKTSKVSIRLV